MDHIEGEEHGSFIKGMFFGAVTIVCVVFLFLPDIVVDNAMKVFTYGDSIYCKKRYDLGNRVVQCELEFPELDGIKKVFCYSKEKGISCQVHAKDEFVTPGYLKDLM